MALCDKWVALKIVEFLLCVACLVAKRVSQDDEARLALLLQKLSREWSLLTSITWDSVGGAFAHAIYGGYVIITFGLVLARVFQEIPKGRRILEGYFLGFGMLFFIVLGGLELASLESVPRNLVVNASVLGSLSLAVAALFLVDLMGPRTYFATHHSQTDLGSPTKDTVLFSKDSVLTKEPIISSKDTKTTTNEPVSTAKDPVSPKTDKKVSISTHTANNGHLPSDKLNGKPAERPKDLDLEKGKDTTDSRMAREESSLFDEPSPGYTKFVDKLDHNLEKSKFGSIRTDFEGGNYIRISDPLSELHYEQELAKFNEKYYRDYIEQVEGKLSVKENYLPELQTPVFAKVKSGRMKSLYEDLSPSYEHTRQSKSPTRAKTVSTPTLQQLEDYLKGSNRGRRADTPLFPMEPIEEKEKEASELEGRASGTPTDPGYVQYTAGKWPEKRNIRTPRHSPT